MQIKIQYYGSDLFATKNGSYQGDSSRPVPQSERSTPFSCQTFEVHLPFYGPCKGKENLSHNMIHLLYFKPNFYENTGFSRKRTCVLNLILHLAETKKNEYVFKFVNNILRYCSLGKWTYQIFCVHPNNSKRNSSWIQHGTQDVKYSLYFQLRSDRSNNFHRWMIYRSHHKTDSRFVYTPSNTLKLNTVNVSKWKLFISKVKQEENCYVILYYWFLRRLPGFSPHIKYTKTNSFLSLFFVYTYEYALPCSETHVASRFQNLTF